MEQKAQRKLLVATRNLGKVREFQALLKDIPFEIISVDQAGVTEEVQETGNSFEENACLKARAYAGLSGLLTLADDSGLEVDALAGAPGVKSARYGGPDVSDEGRVALLLENLRDVAWEDRIARFRCVIAIAWASGEVSTVDGVVEGLIQYEPKGANGFGYDPVFYLPSLGRTAAELSLEEKNALSHRGQAAGKAVSLLNSLVAQCTAGRQDGPSPGFIAPHEGRPNGPS